jgi:predicted ATPase
LQKDTYNSQTNWYVITGGPGSGKTTTVNLLKGMGYKTTIEHARHYIDTMRIKGRTVEEIRRNQMEFQTGILDMQIEEEQSHAANEIMFLDRAIPDALAYYRFLNIPEDEKLKNALKKINYKKIFILDPLTLVNDYARIEDASAQKQIHLLITEVYESIGFPIVHVPVLPPEDRVKFILENM